jgi:PIN domain nuclease of toxin-antitoxin system
MLLLDTCALIHDALTPARLGPRARAAIEAADAAGALALCAISLWEVGMLVAHGRLDPGTDCRSFLRLVLTARSPAILPITVDIAARAAALPLHGDPADRIIAATAIEHGATLATSDRRLRRSRIVPTIW